VPSGLEGVLQIVAHTVGGVGVEAAHAGYLVAEALLGEDLGDAFLGHPGLVAVPEAVRGQAGSDGEPAGEWGVGRNDRDATASGRKVFGVRGGSRIGGWPGGDRDAGPGGLIGDDQASIASWR
jgi:hypothetical protein